MKKRVTFTLDESTIEELRDVSKQTLIPQSRLVEQALLKIIEEHKKESK